MVRDDRWGRRRIKVVTESGSDLARRGRKWVEETTLAQGVSVQLTDLVALLTIVRIFGWDRPAPESAPTRSRGSRGQA